ncbi:MAG: hypothetical protein HQL20_09680 [Candidatus Omnitrophica bacterium]|nr:hypothetical protein [Candidatus Omnitrophota bacterium]
MSIIHDALKKVQSKTPSPVVTPPAPANAATSVPGKGPTGNAPTDNSWSSLTILMAAVLTVAVVVIFAVILKLANDTTKHAPRAVIPTSTEPAANTQKIPAVTDSTGPSTPATVPQPAEPPATKPLAKNNSLKIEGVMDMGGKMVALINGEVYEEGQTVSGNLITMITFDSITIMENGTKKVLPIKP